jgi:hypothetical protein
LQHSLILGKIISKEQVVALEGKRLVAESYEDYLESISKKNNCIFIKNNILIEN